MRLSRKRRAAKIDLLPLMDVVFLILVFLIYAVMSMTIQKGMQVNLPFSQTSSNKDSVSIAITIQSDGIVWLEKNRIDLDKLPGELKNMALKFSSEPVLQIFGDSTLQYQSLFNLLDVLRSAGFKKISLQSRPAGAQ